MSDFEKAVQFVLSREGELNENKEGFDSGGITNRGISLRFLREVKEENLRRYGIFEEVSEQTIRELTTEQIKLIYKGEFWDGNRFEEILSQNLCNYIFDMVIAHGVGQAIKLVQRAIWAATFTRFYVKDDGVIGHETLEAVNSLSMTQLLPAIVATRAAFYALIAEERPKDKVFLEGWLNRCYSAF